MIKQIQLLCKSGNIFRSPKIEPISAALENISHEHAEIHEKEMFYIYGRGVLNAGQSLDIFIKNESNFKLHMLPIFQGSGRAGVIIYENPVVNIEGALLGAQNCDFSAANDTDVFYSIGTTTFIDPGTEKIEYLAGLSQTQGGGTRAVQERIFKANTNYLIRATSETATNYGSFLLEYYKKSNDIIV